jgi:hypothetical protein
VEVNAEDWKVVVAHTDHNCTSDDWSFYTSDLGQQLDPHGVVYAYGDPVNDVAVVTRSGAEVARFPLKGQGFTAARAGKPVEEVEYGMTSEMMPKMGAYFGF